MKISLNWVKEFIDVDISNDELVKVIGAQLGAVEEVEDWSLYYDDNIVVGEIVEAKEHPDADKLGVYKLKINEDGEERQVVAGDKNLEVGDKVGYIPPGANVPVSVRQGEPFTISERELRGVLSQGMLGSAKELLISEDHEGVLKLDIGVVGARLSEAYGLDDFVIDVENKMFTHRPDLFGVLGCAREIAAITGNQFNSPEWYSLEFEDAYNQELPNKYVVNVDNRINEKCLRFTAVVLELDSILPSLNQMKARLLRVGINAKSNVVDITNWVMFLTGQPLHAFDYDKVVATSNSETEANLIIRMAENGEKLTLLDGREIELSDEDMVVASDKGVLSVAGAIGGIGSEIDANSKRILLELASWDLYSIRRTSFRHGIFTDAVTRYNKGQSVWNCRVVSAYAANLLTEFAGCEIASQFVDDFENEGAFKKEEIEVSEEFINQRLGSNFQALELQEILQRVEIFSDVNEGSLRVKVPFWREDLIYAEDIVEEVGRIYGYDNLPIVLPKREIQPVLRDESLKTKHEVRGLLSGIGGNEVYTYNFVSSDLLKKSNIDEDLHNNVIRIRNSISPELEFMRPVITSSLIEKAWINLRRKHETFELFEVNKVHAKDYKDESDNYVERLVVSSVICMSEMPGNSRNTYFQAKARADYLLSKLGVDYSFEKIDEDRADSTWLKVLIGIYEPKLSAWIVSEDKVIGVVGEFRHRVNKNFKLGGITHSSGYEVDITNLKRKEQEYVPLSKFPITTQDLTFEIPNEMSADELMVKFDDNFKLSGVVDVKREIISIYRGENARRRITLRATISPSDKTLETKEVNKAIEDLALKLESSDISHI